MLASSGRAVRTEKADVQTKAPFAFAEPAPQSLNAKRTLWATWYWTPSFRSKGAVPLLDSRERPLGPHLEEEDYCHAAVEGAVRIDGTVYTFDTTGKIKLADCKSYEPDMPQAPYVRFHKSASPFGEGERGYFLVPYRTIAVDPKVIPMGSLVYIPAARGALLTLPDGKQAMHDGYFLAGDTGYGIADNHIDVFIGISDKNPFRWIVSEASATFDAYIVDDPQIKAKLREAHRSTDSPGSERSRSEPALTF